MTRFTLPLPLPLPLLLASAILAPGVSSAGPFDALYVFGDSLSDRGNFAAASGTAFPNPPSFHDSFTNGPTAVSLLANSMGLAADPSLWLNGFADTNGIFPPGYVPGTNYAVGGATAQMITTNGVSPDINLPQQTAAYLAHSGGVADPDALYTIFIGGNDVIGASKPKGGGSAAIEAGVAAELNTIRSLEAAGAKNFFVVNVPDVSEIPLVSLENPSWAANAALFTTEYNSDLAAGIDGLADPGGVDIKQFDLFTYNHKVLANAAAFGITNTTDPCYTKAPFETTTSAACGPGAENIGHFAYWNDVHPTKEVHALWAKGFEESLAGDPDPSPVPEAASWAYMIIGFAGLGWVARHLRRSRRAAPLA